MGPIRVEGQGNHMSLDPIFHLLLLRAHVDHFNQALHGVGSLSVARYLQDVRLQSLQDLQPLGRRRTLQQLLTEIVPVLVSHQLMQMVQALIDGKTYEVWRGSGQQLLQVLGTLLLTGHLYHLPLQLILEGGAFIFVLSLLLGALSTALHAPDRG